MEQYEAFIVALPDSDDSAPLVRRLQGSVNVTLHHASGRPWLLARVPDELPLRYVCKPVPLAVVGPTSARTEDLEEISQRVRAPHELAEISCRFDGSFCVFGSIDGVLYANGPAMQTRQVFHAVIDGVRVLCDRADVLSELGGLPLDEIALGLRLARGLPYPADRLPMWQGVSAVPGPRYVLIRRDGREVEHGTWWRRPEPSLTRADGAALLRDALETAVRVRTETEAEIACDLSGGLDSTPLCYFAARGPKGVVARTFYTDDPGGREDLEWARRALPAMPGVHTHDVFSTQGLPGFYEGLYDLAIPMDEPTQAGAAIPRIGHMLADDVKRGVTIHLNGLGGDHLLRGVKAWNHTLMRAKPLTAWSRSRAEDAPMGIGPLSTLRQLLDRRTYRQWYLATVRDAARGAVPPELPRINDWSVPLSLPDWLTADARASMIDRLRRLGAEATPLGTGLAGHFDVFTVQQAGRLARSMGLVGQALGVSYDAPLLDDHVVEAVFQVRYEERDSPIEWKPLMKAAMTGLLPDDYLRRTTKIGGAPQSVRGYAAHFDALHSLWEDSGLLGSGLIDRSRLLSSARPSATAMPSPYVHALTNAAIFLQTWNSTTRRRENEQKEPSWRA